jgi:hypothetical protein
VLRGFRRGRRSYAVADERGDRLLERDAIEVLHKVDDIATDAAAAAIEHPLLDVDRKAIGAAAFWTRSLQLDTGPSQFDAATRDLLLDGDGPGAIDVGVSIIPLAAGEMGHLAPPPLRCRASRCWHGRLQKQVKVRGD